MVSKIVMVVVFMDPWSTGKIVNKANDDNKM